MKGFKVVDIPGMFYSYQICSTPVLNICTSRNCHFRLLLGRFSGQNSPKWAISEKIQTGVGVEDMEFPGVLNKERGKSRGLLKKKWNFQGCTRKKCVYNFHGSWFMKFPRGVTQCCRTSRVELLFSVEFLRVK